MAVYEFTPDEGEEIQKESKADFYEMYILQNRGKYFMTQKRFVMIYGLCGNRIEFKYEDIVSVEKCLTWPFFPFGVLVSAKDENGNIKKYRFGVLGRQTLIDDLKARAGLAK